MPISGSGTFRGTQLEVSNARRALSPGVLQARANIELNYYKSVWSEIETKIQKLDVA